MSKVEKLRDEEATRRHFDESIKIMRGLLQLMGLWSQVSYPKVLRLALIGCICSILLVFTVPIMLFMLLIVKDFQTQVRLVGPLSFALMNMLKYTTVLLKEGQLDECVDWMAKDWRSAGSRLEEDLMLRNSKSARKFSLVCVSWMYISGLSYSALFSFLAEPMPLNNGTARVFAVPSYFIFFDPHEHFYKVWTMQTVAGFVQFSVTGAMASIGIVCVKHTCGQIAITSWMLHSIAARSFDAQAFGRIIEKHLRAVAFAKKLEDYLNGLCLVELTGCCLNICLLGYYFIMERNQSLLGSYPLGMLMLSFVCNIFIFCYMGDQLTEKCDAIGNAAYNIEWYHFSPKQASNLLMIIASTQRPVVLTAGKMATLSMTCFSSVIKASFSYLNMLRTVTNY